MFCILFFIDFCVHLYSRDNFVIGPVLLSLHVIKHELNWIVITIFALLLFVYFSVLMCFSSSVCL
jgi:hypothetical protein